MMVLSQGPLITEISYDNNYDQALPFGIDSIEYVEIYLPNPQPVDLTSFKIVSYNEVSGTSTDAEVAFVKDLEDTLRTWNTPNGKYYVIEFVDSSFFGFPIGGIRDGDDGIALVEIASPNIVHQFWRYETCTDFTAIDGPALGAVSSPLTSDASQTCGTSGASLVQMNSALSTSRSLQQNGFGDWVLAENSARAIPLENPQNVPVDMMYFNIQNQSDQVTLNWATAQEFDNDYFVVYHSRNAKDFNELTRVDGKGNNSGKSKYSYQHRNPGLGIHYYKIRQVDFNGNYEDYPIKSIERLDHVDVKALPVMIYNEFQLINVEIGTAYQIYNMNGQLVKNGAYNHWINISDLSSGIYSIVVKGQNIRIVKW